MAELTDNQGRLSNLRLFRKQAGEAFGFHQNQGMFRAAKTEDAPKGGLEGVQGEG